MVLRNSNFMVASTSNSAVLTRPLWSRAQGLIGVDFGTRIIKLAQIRGAGRTCKVAAVHLVPVDGRAGLSSSTIDHGAVRRSLSGMTLRRHGFSGRRAVAVLPTSICEPRAFEFPVGNDREVSHMLEQELNSSGVGQCDFWRCESLTGSDGQLQRITAVDVSERTLLRCIEDQSSVGLHCEAIDALPFALARAVTFAERDRYTGPVAALDWSAGRPLLVLIEKGRPVFTRVLRDCGLEPAIDRVRSQLEIDEQECAQLLMTCGIRGGSRATIEVARVIERLLAESVDQTLGALQTTLEFIKTRSPDSSPGKIWLFGCGGAVAGMDELLTAQLGIATHAWQLEEGRFCHALHGLSGQPILGAAIGMSLLDRNE